MGIWVVRGGHDPVSQRAAEGGNGGRISAMATTAVSNEVEQVRQIVEQVTLPSGVKLKSVGEGWDWEGDPVWRIIFTVSKRIPLTKPFVRSLTTLTHEVIRQVSSLGLGKFPMVDFTESR